MLTSWVTQVVLLLDVDFVPPEELSRIFSARQEYQSTLVYLYNNAVIVLPAFETLQGGAEGQKLALKLARGASALLKLLQILPQSVVSDDSTSKALVWTSEYDLGCEYTLAVCWHALPPSGLTAQASLKRS